MNATQINAMRTMWETTSQAEQTMTMREMALTGASMAHDTTTLRDGSKWYLEHERFVWVRYA
jgi:hypothetical protein